LSLCCQRLSETIFSPRCFGLFSAAPCGAASGVRSGSRYLVSVAFAVKDFVKLSSATPIRSFLGCALRRGVGGSEAGGGVCSRAPPFGKYFCRSSSFCKKGRYFMGFRPSRTDLLCSDQATGPGGRPQGEPNCPARYAGNLRIQLDRVALDTARAAQNLGAPRV